MDMKKPLAKGIPWLHLENVIIIKISLTAGIVAAYLVPPPYNILVGGAANLVWLWKKL